MRFFLILILCFFSFIIVGCLDRNSTKSSIDEGAINSTVSQIPAPTRYIITVGISTETAVVPTDYRNLILENRNDLEKTPPGTYLLYTDWKSSNNVFGINIKTKEEINISENMYSYSNDRNLVAYLDDDRNLMILNLNTEEEEIALNLRCYGGNWSPDDRYLAINCEDKIYVIRTKDFDVQNMTSWAHPSVDSFQNPSWSPDGKWIATTYHQLNSLNSTEDNGIYLIESGCIEHNSLCEDLSGPFFPFSIHSEYSWSPDSEHIVTYINNALQVVNIKTTETIILIEQIFDVGGLFWSLDDDWIYFSQFSRSESENAINIYQISAQGGEPILVADDKGYIFGLIEVSN